ncbi:MULTISPECIES: SWIM zinc finger family protein [Haloferax]|uniref:SWIM zinc finger family protein n=2 Tax=Haloferax TaxID=2251 RepID=A0A6G1Z7P2_9EURY|nr:MULTISPECIES: SWIM zinc finger family protein [Haloferax]KAB1184807.1 SWIM zinc finger family protein [Haloferax sp. CBA1149]MRW82438.1 SWIM zinc finger family protein [Haloferax marinisediminis]
MSESLLARLDPTKRVLKRAQYEAFEFSLFDGDVLVRNASHAEPENHEYNVQYNVRMIDGVPTSCGCPADQRYTGPCKHRIAVAIRRSILDAVEQMQMVADGGAVTDEQPETGVEDDATPDDCDCDVLDDYFPCWACVDSGRRELPE